MTAPNPAVDAQPGKPFADAKGGTWVRIARGAGKLDWWHTNATGTVLGWRSQSEAEEAGLVPLVAERDEREYEGSTSEEFVALCGAIQHWDRGEDDRRYPVWVGNLASALLARGYVLAPAPLDPGNPEHLRQVVQFVMSCYIGEDDDVIAEQVRALATSLHARADRLDRERAEAEQDAKDRERAEEYARAEAEREHRAIGGWNAMRADIREWHIALALGVIRAERARTKETGPC